MMDTIHVWIGEVSVTTEEFSSYFVIDPADRDAGVGASQFDKEVGTGWYDDDLVGVYYRSNSNDLAAALDEIPATPEALAQIQAKCSELGITKANAMFYYTDSDLVIADAAKKYNSLTYLGAFDNR